MSLFNRGGRDERRPRGDVNTGVQNSGTMGNVQNQPGASDSSQHQVNTGDDAAKQAELSRILAELDAALTRERALLTDPDRCKVLFDTVRDLDLTEEADRTAAGSMLRRLADNCGGAANVTTLVASALTILTTVAG